MQNLNSQPIFFYHEYNLIYIIPHLQQKQNLSSIKKNRLILIKRRKNKSQEFPWNFKYNFCYRNTETNIFLIFNFSLRIQLKKEKKLPHYKDDRIIIYFNEKYVLFLLYLYLTFNSCLISIMLFMFFYVIYHFNTFRFLSSLGLSM